MAVLNAVLSLISYPLFLHFLGYQQYGVWLALSTVLTLAQIGNLGINPAVSKLVAESHGQLNSRGIQRSLTAAWLVVLLAGVVVLSIVIGANERIISVFGLAGASALLMSHLLPWVALFSLYVFIVEILNAALVGLGRADLESYYRTISQAIALAVPAVLLVFGSGVESLLIGNAAAYFVMHLLSLVSVRRMTGTRLLVASSLDFSGLSRMFRFGGWVFGGSILTMTLHPLNRILISRFAGVAALPVYEIAFGSAMRIRTLLEGGIRALMPEISRVSSRITLQTLSRAATLKRAGGRFIRNFGIPMYGFLALFASPMLRMWLTSRFQPQFPVVFRIMLVASFLSLLCVPSYYILMGLGEARSCFVSSAIQCFASFGLIGVVFALTGRISVTTVSSGLVAGMGLCTFYLLWKMNSLTDNASNFMSIEDVVLSGSPESRAL